MTRLISYPAVAAAAALAASCAPMDNRGFDRAAGAEPMIQCFSPEHVRNFRAGGPAELYIRGLRDQVFELNTTGGCTNLDFTHRLAITPDGPSIAAGRVCTGDWVRIHLPDSTPGFGTCRARVSRALTEAEVAALPDAHRP